MDYFDYISDQDRFYVDADGTVIWLYYNPDSCSGGQFVYHSFDISLLKKIVDECADESGELVNYEKVFSELEKRCRQELHDKGTVWYKYSENMFKQFPDSIGLTRNTIYAILYLGDFKRRYIRNH